MASRSRLRAIDSSDRQKPAVEQMDFIWELWTFVRERKKFWILPILAIALLFGGLIILGQTSVLTPFIYTLF